MEFISRKQGAEFFARNEILGGAITSGKQLICALEEFYRLSTIDAKMLANYVISELLDNNKIFINFSDDDFILVVNEENQTFA